MIILSIKILYEELFQCRQGLDEYQAFLLKKNSLSSMIQRIFKDDDDDDEEKEAPPSKSTQDVSTAVVLAPAIGGSAELGSSAG